MVQMMTVYCQQGVIFFFNSIQFFEKIELLLIFFFFLKNYVNIIVLSMQRMGHLGVFRVCVWLRRVSAGD